MIASTAGVASLFPLLFTPAGMRILFERIVYIADFTGRTNHRGCIFSLMGDYGLRALTAATIRVSRLRRPIFSNLITFSPGFRGHFLPLSSVRWRQYTYGVSSFWK
jgi:hypothetical protein